MKGETMKKRDEASTWLIGFMMGVVIGVLVVFAFAPPAHATPPCQAVANTVSQIPNGVEHFTMLHTTGFTTTCQAGTRAQVTTTIQKLESGTWTDLASVTSPVKYISPSCRNSGCRTASATVDRNPCVDGTYRTVATGGDVALPPSSSTSAPTSIDCYGDA